MRLLHRVRVRFLATTDQPGVEWADRGGDRCPFIRPSTASIRYIIFPIGGFQCREGWTITNLFILPKSSFNSSLVFVRRYGSSASSQFELRSKQSQNWVNSGAAVAFYRSRLNSSFQFGINGDLTPITSSSHVCIPYSISCPCFGKLYELLKV